MYRGCINIACGSENVEIIQRISAFNIYIKYTVARARLEKLRKEQVNKDNLTRFKSRDTKAKILTKAFRIENSSVKSGLRAIRAAAVCTIPIRETIRAGKNSRQPVRRCCASVSAACIGGKINLLAINNTLQRGAIGIDRD